MKILSLCCLVGVTSILHLDAFISVPRNSLTRPCSKRVNVHKDDESSLRTSQSPSGSSGGNLCHEDILWKLRPPPESSSLRRLWLRFAANVIRLDCLLRRVDPPLVLCPKGGQAVLEAYCSQTQPLKMEKIGRFGITTERGAPSSLIQETAADIYGINADVSIGVGAIIYMYVEPQFRKKSVGSLALEVIFLIHAIQGCDFTVLVVDDNGSGNLIDWYEQNGFSKAPKLQELLGSPNGIHGITMIAPTRRELPDGLLIEWW